MHYIDTQRCCGQAGYSQQYKHTCRLYAGHQAIAASCVDTHDRYHKELLKVICMFMQGTEPLWPAVLASMTAYTDVANSTFASAAQHMDGLAQKLFGQAEVPMLMYPGEPVHVA